MNLYYVILTEWNYPTESGHNIYDYYDDLETAKAWVKKIGDNEWNNFLEVCEDIYSEASGFHTTNARVQTNDPYDINIIDVPGYSIHSSQYEEYDFWFIVRVIPIKIYE